MVTSLTKRSDYPEWSEYMAACRRNGEQCTKCNTFIYPPSGEPRLCHACESIEEPGELTHERYVRCPECGATMDAMDSDDHDLLYEGEHDLWCDKCDAKYSVTTNVSYSFVSPERREPK